MIIPATVEILDQLEPLGYEFFKEAKFVAPFNWEVFRAAWRNLISSKTGEIFVAVKDGQPIGAIGAVIYSDPLTGELTAQEGFWFVTASHRGVGLRLLAHLTDWASSKRARKLVMMALQSLNPNEMDNLYKRMGFRHIESVYSKEIWA